MDPQFLNMSLINSLRTGNIIVDLIIAAMVPAICVGLWNSVQRYWYAFGSYLKRIIDANGRTYTRHIAHTKTTPFDDEMDECANHVLQNAIRTYIGSQLPSHYLRGNVRLSEIKSLKGGGGMRSRWDDDETEEHGTAVGKSVFDSGALKVLSLPNTQAGPVEIYPGLKFQEVFHMDENDDDERNQRNVRKPKMSELIYTLTSAGYGGKSGKAVVDEFIAKVLEWYTVEVTKHEDDSRWMYQPLVSTSGAADRLYKRYKLSSEKSFNSLFFQDKARVIRVLDAFTKKTGKYQIKGFPHRLSMLLHGPPGTGKTSLVKAIALYTNRHVVSVPLSRMKTNQEFMDVMMDCVFKYCMPASSKKDDDSEADDDGGTKRAQLNFDNIVFLLEDVDAASTVVHRKTNNNNTAANNNGSEPSAAGYQPKRAAPENADGEADAPIVSISGAVEDEGMGGMVRETTTAYQTHAAEVALPPVSSEDGEGEPAAAAADNKSASNIATPTSSVPPQMPLPSVTPSAGKSTPPPEPEDEGGDSSESDLEDKKRGRRSRANKEEKKNDTTEQLAKMCQMLIQQQGAANKKGGLTLQDLLADGADDALCLESILTVLDGVIDTPGRILVMTTNHPERLDPALIRNGRINMKLYMGYLSSTQVEHMARHYYPQANNEAIASLVEAFKTLGDVSSGGGGGDIATTRISPAEFEQLCAECDEVGDLSARLITMGNNRPSALPSKPNSGGDSSISPTLAPIVI